MKGGSKVSRDELIKKVNERDAMFLLKAELTEEEALLALDYWPSCLEFLNIQTPAICLKAVSNHGLSLEDVKEQTKEICIAAVKQNWNALKFVKEEFKEAAKSVLKGREPAIASADIYCGGQRLHGILVYEKSCSGSFWGIAPIVNGIVEPSNTCEINLGTLSFIGRDENFFDRGLYNDLYHTFYSLDEAVEQIGQHKPRARR